VNRRRKLLVALGASALTAPLASFAQQQGKVWRIGFLGTASASGYVKEIDAIRAGLRDLGYVEGRNIIIEYRWAESNPERLKEMAAELVALKVDVLIAHSTLGVRTAAQATKTIPIVIADATDPVAAGLVASLARPGGNITGSTSFQPEIAAKRLELLKEVVPRLKRVSTLFNALSANNEVYIRELEPAAKQMKVELHQFEVRTPEELLGAFAAMAKKRVEAAVIGEDPLLNTNAGAIAALAVAHRLPASGFTNFAGAGGLLGYGANRPLVYGRAANFVDKILKGAKPGDLPIERATKFDLIVNLKTAKALGIKIPQSILVRADKVIE
jgi:putative ABC transport system substrate-binding protein